MSIAVTIAGPASPRALAGWLSGSDRNRALATPGIGGRSVNNLVGALLEAGASVEVVTLDEELSERVTFEGPRLRILSAPYRSCARERGRDFFRAERRHVRDLVAATSGAVVDAHWTYEFALGALACPGRSTLITARDSPFTILRYRPDLYRAIRAALSVVTRLRAPALAANSPYLASIWRRQLLYRKPIAIVPNIIPPAVSSGQASWNGTPPTILDISADGRLKNVAALVYAMPEILRNHPDARARLVGPGLDDGSPLAALAERLGVRDAIVLVGRVDEEAVGSEYAAAVAFVHPSLEESFGLSVAEAMSHALPVVAGSGAGAVPWVLDDGRAGLLVDVRRPGEIAAAVSRLLDDESLRAKLGTAAADRVRSAFSPSVVAEIWLDLYERMAQARQ